MGAEPVQTQTAQRELEARTRAIGQRLFELAKRERAQLTHFNRWAQQVLRWCLGEAEVKSRVLRFIDCLPSLHTPRQVLQHVREYFPTDRLRLPTALRLGVSVSRAGLLTAPAVSAVIHQAVEQVAKQFIAGTRVEQAGQIAQILARRSLSASFDVLGELVVSEREADDAAARYLKLIDALAGKPSPHLSIKPSSLTAHLDPIDFDDSVERALARLRPIAAKAVEANVAFTLDMEHYQLRDVTLELAKRLLLDPQLGKRLRLGVVLQAYLLDSERVLEELLEWLTQHDRQLAIRLVKGAYWDHEIALAKQRNWPIPVYQQKAQTDAAFERLTERLIGHPAVRPEIASHNIRSIAHAMALLELRGLPPSACEFQLLYGMGDAIQAAITELGYPVRVYTPIGELIPGMAYLVRRLLENTANESFLRQDLWEHASSLTLLAPPHG